MTETMKALAMRMVKEYAEKEWQLNYEYVVKTAYLAGFEAHDGMESEEHAEMLDALRNTYHMLKNIKGYAYTATHIYNLITKIESKNTNSI